MRSPARLRRHLRGTSRRVRFGRTLLRATTLFAVVSAAIVLITPETRKRGAIQKSTTEFALDKLRSAERALDSNDVGIARQHVETARQALETDKPTFVNDRKEMAYGSK